MYIVYARLWLVEKGSFPTSGSTPVAIINQYGVLRRDIDFRLGVPWPDVLEKPPSRVVAGFRRIYPTHQGQMVT